MRIEHINDPDAPPANSLIPAASAVVVNDTGRILLHRRVDNDLWSIPGGAMEIGESIADTALREVAEETGLGVEVDTIIGIYTNPSHVVEYSDGEVRQQFSVRFLCHPVGGTLTADGKESSEVGWFTPAEIETLKMNESIRLRISHYLDHRSKPVIA